MLLGEVLIKNGSITEKQLKKSLTIQRKCGSTLGMVLLSQGIINPLQLANALAEQFGVPYYDFNNIPSKETIQKVVDALGEEYIRKNMFAPICEDEKTIWIAMARPQDEEVVKKVREVTGKKVEKYVASERDIYKIIEKEFREMYIKQSSMGLFYRSPQESAFTTFTKQQKVFMCLFAIVNIGLMIVNWQSYTFWLFFLVNLFYVISIGFKFVASFVGANTTRDSIVSDEEVKQLKDEELPVYTILLPMYKEPEVLPKLIKGISDLDYPISKLDVKILLEEDDDITYNRLKELQPPANFEVFRVPLSTPKTKPKACNYGLMFAKGEYLTIYDAEDIPEKDQLKKAIVAFKKGPTNLVCVQAALNYFNATDNVLTRMFTLEYSYWFDYMLPGIDWMGLPIPLGGTSNHFKTDYLRELGGWDSFNVTEDADLGVRASSHNLLVSTINSTTYEEANGHYGNWIRQRSRWIKGYMQTYLVHMRNPMELYRKIGLKEFLGFQLMIGGTPFIFLMNMVLWSISIIWILFSPWFINIIFSDIILYMSLFTMIVGNFTAIIFNILAVFHRKNYNLMPYALLNPIYWIMHSIAAVKALYQLFVNPFYWEKTQHGLTKKENVK